MKPLPCFVCGGSSIGVDHIPPKVFFPERKDLLAGMPDMRRQLLTLPACAAHNQDLSADDEYAAYSVVTNITNNAISRHHLATKMLRALRRRPTLASTILRSPRGVRLGSVEAVAFTTDRARLDRVFPRVARGIFFHLRGTPFRRSLYWTSPNMAYADMTRDPRALIFERADLPRDDPQLPYYAGSIGHPSVFTYEMWSVPSEERMTLWRMVFYEGFVVNVFSTDE